MHFVAILLAGTLGVHADTLPLSWRLADFLAAVEARSPDLTAARAEQRAADARLASAGRLPDPRVQLGLMNRSVPGFGKRSPLAMDQIQVMQMLPVPGKLAAAAARARAEAGITGADAIRRRSGVRLRAAGDFFELDRVDRSVAALERTGYLLRQIEGVSRAMYAAGSGPQASVLRAQIELARLEEEVIALGAARAGIAARLNALLWRPQALPFGTVLMPELPESLPPIAVLVDAALRAGPSLGPVRGRLAVALAGRRGADLERWPDLELGLAYGRQPMIGEPGTDQMVSLMIGASLPLWAGRSGAMRREAAAMAEAAQAEVRMVEAEIHGRIGELVAEFQRAGRLRRLYRGTILPQARGAAASALAAYRTGGVSLEVVLEAQLTVSRVDLQLIQLDAEQARAVAELETLTLHPFMLASPGGLP
jgi:cobalt-zinc-cadmium efflux system outer membrane protein